ncbi:MAG: DUF1963 domain-containing protein [Clostridiales bacterium]|nr:DUF1963 domain-containing protein [Clostridiales bacterium]
MNEKIKKFRKIAIIYTVLAIVLIVVYSILKALSYPYASPAFPIVGGIIALAAVVCWVLYGLGRKKIKEKRQAEEGAKQEFAEWLKEFEPLTKTSAELIHADSDSKSFSKFGGLPIVPDNFEWPTLNGNPMPFVLQLDFSEINSDGRLNNLPVSGLMYLFVEEVFEPEFDYIPKILFFDKANKLSCANVPNNLQKKYKEIFVAPNYIKTYPDVSDCDEAFKISCNRPFGGMDDEYDALSEENVECHLVGGWPSHLQGSFEKIREEIDGDKWVLLLQVKSESSENFDEELMWGDCGLLYIYIREKDLIARNFNNVILEMQCY